MNLDFLRSFFVPSVVVPFVVPVLLFGASACSTSRYRDARYTPAPMELEVATAAAPGSQVRALVSVLGVARADENAGHGEQVEVRLRFENLGTVDARVATDAFALLSADLVPFEPGVVAKDADVSVPVGASRSMDVVFPVTKASRDWSGLNLRFALTFGDARATAGATFERVVYAPYPYPEPVHWHVGFHYGHYW